jgi:hypothetical protein
MKNYDSLDKTLNINPSSSEIVEVEVEKSDVKSLVVQENLNEKRL